MGFQLPIFHPPNFSGPGLAGAPLARFAAVERDGVAPDQYHATSIFPEYVHLRPGVWELAAPSRMDAVIVRTGADTLEVKECRRLRQGEAVLIGRSEDGEEGIWVHTGGFGEIAGGMEKFAFRTGRKLRWDTEKEEIVEDRAASELLGRKARKPWDVI